MVYLTVTKDGGLFDGYHTKIPGADTLRIRSGKGRLLFQEQILNNQFMLDRLVQFANARVPIT